MESMRENNGASVMMATNRLYHLDEALLQRLPRKLLVGLPLKADRAEIQRIHLKSVGRLCVGGGPREAHAALLRLGSEECVCSGGDERCEGGA